MKREMMAADKKHRDKPDHSRVNTDEEREIRYWTRKFGVTSQQLNEAVKTAGISVEAVQKALRK
jgi:hypothetical protein